MTGETVSELGDGIWRFDLGSVNCYLVDDDGALTLVDAGTPGDSDDIAAGFATLDHELADVERVLVTHYDYDHVGSLSRLPGLDAPVYVGEAEARLLSGERRPTLRNHKGLVQRVAGLFLRPPPLTVRPVTDGDEVGSFTAYHTPGHGPGHVAWVSERLDVAFLGDLVRGAGGDLEPSGWLKSYDTDEVRQSIRSLAKRAPPFAIAAMGHGRPLTAGGKEKLDRLAARV